MNVPVVIAVTQWVPSWIIVSVFAILISAITGLAIALSDTRERLARVEERTKNDKEVR